MDIKVPQRNGCHTIRLSKDKHNQVRFWVLYIRTGLIAWQVNPPGLHGPCMLLFIGLVTGNEDFRRGKQVVLSQKSGVKPTPECVESLGQDLQEIAVVNTGRYPTL